MELLKIVRFLRELGINMYFENENLDSIKKYKEFEITLSSMLAQDERPGLKRPGLCILRN